MDSIVGHAQDRTLREKLSQNVQSTYGNNPGETHTSGGVQPEAFVYHSLKIRKAFDDFRGCDWVFLSEGLIKFSLELGLDGGILGEVVDDSTQSTSNQVVSVNSGEKTEDGEHLTWRWYLSHRSAE